MHKARLGPHLGRRQTRQYRVLERARDPTTDRQKRLKARMSVRDALAHAGHGVRDIVETRAAQPFLIQHVHSLLALAAPVFEVGSGAAHLGDEALEHLGNRVARPGGGHADPNTVDTLQSEGTWSELVVLGVTGQDGQYLACAQANTDVDHPDETIAKRCLAKGQTLERTGRFEAHDAESHDPIDDGLRAWRFLDAKRPGE